MFKQQVEEFLKDTDKDKVHANLDENSMVISVGCDLNHLEAEKVRTLIKNANTQYKICVIHTCTAYNAFISLTKSIIEFVKSVIPQDYAFVLTGCGVDSFKDIYPSLMIVPNDKKFDIESYHIPQGTTGKSGETALGLVQIQTGCNNQCSYCLFPKLKGNHSVSKTKEEILDLIKYNISSGVKHITLTGVNICQYEEPNEKTGLVELLQYIVKSQLDINKISLYSIDPAWNEVFKLMDFIEKEPLMSKDLYLATQSGSDNVLKRMNRRHNRLRVKSIIDHSINIKVRHDFIVGHPGETDEDFQQSVDLLRYSQEDDVVGGIAEFYAHEGTASYYMDDKVSPEKSKERYDIMTNKVNNIVNLINQEVKCIQFELWHNCTNECAFCYLNGCRKVYSDAQKQASIQKVLNILDSDRVNGFNAIGLIGGELFMGQQGDQTTKEKFQQLIHKIKSFLNQDKIKEVWLTSNLMTDKIGSLVDTLEILMEDLPRYQRIMLCTSYDTKGRFHSEEAYNQWYDNIMRIKDRFPRLCIHIQTICTQAFINEWLKSKKRFVDFRDKGFLMDFKPPATNAVDFIYNNTGRETYRANLEKFAKTQKYKYLIESREKFMKFWESVAETFPEGVQKLRDFNSNKVKSECCYSVPWDEWFEDRWENNKENAPCGHCWDGYCYKDYPEKCAKCDVEKLIKMLEKK